MRGIISRVESLTQYLLMMAEGSIFYETDCPHCGKSGIWLHGCYPRKADRSCKPGESLNPILIQRFFCPNCRRTSSVLPECIPPKRWYLWDIQQAALLLLLAGKSLNAVAQKMMPSRHTVKRWLTLLKEQLHLYKDVLCNHFIELGCTLDFFDFWPVCFKRISLAGAMRLCHVSGVPVP